MARAKTRVPETMRAVAVNRFGGPSVLKVETLPVPVPGPTDVLIAVEAAGVADWDADIREGWWPEGEHPPFPMVLGSDGAGVVAAVGARVTRFEPGDKVYAFSFPEGGFWAEYTKVPQASVGHIPKGLDMLQAGALPATGLTALQGVDDALHIKRGESVIVHGASGGVGSIALQFAKLRGARVLATASGKDGVALVRRLGADESVDGRRDDIAEAAKEFAPDGVDAILAFAGGPPLTRALDALRRGGRVAHPNGVEPAPRKRRGITIVAYDGLPGVRQFRQLTRTVEAGRIDVPVDSAYAMTQAVKSHRRLAKGHVLGKVVLRVR